MQRRRSVSVILEDDEALERRKALRTVTETPWLERDALRTARDQSSRSHHPSSTRNDRWSCSLTATSRRPRRRRCAQAGGVDLVILSKPHEEPAINELAEGLYALVGGERAEAARRHPDLARRCADPA